MTLSPRRLRPAIRSAFLFFLGFLAVGLLLYPTAADWFSTIGHNNAVGSYAQHAAEQRKSGGSKGILDAADAYNRTLPHGVVRDPYSTASTAPGLDSAAYRAQLGGDDGDVVARLRYPRLKIDLPIYLGTSSDVLRKGVGHLFGSSLPVGGAGTHSVLTGHSGAPYAALFDAIHDAQAGDLITVDVLDRRLTYRVTATETIRPDDTRSLRIEAGQDLLTLLTCTPIGVASHRFLVHAERIPDTDSAAMGAELHSPETHLVDLLLGAWWIGVLLGALVLLYFLTRTPRGNRHVLVRGAEDSVGTDASNPDATSDAKKRPDVGDSADTKAESDQS